MALANVPGMEEVLKNMKIGDTVFHNEIGHIHRVIGGWIYQFNNGGVFVPYSEPKTESDELTLETTEPKTESDELTLETTEPKTESDELTLETTEPKRRGRKPIITK